MRSRVLLNACLLLASTVLLVACGGDDQNGKGKDGANTPTETNARLSPAPRDPRDLPAGIPLEGTGAGDPDAIRVIRLWSDALRESDVKAASALWAVPAKVQNGTPVITLASAKDVRDFNGSLSCGSKLVSGLGAKGTKYIVAGFRLTKRPGADCGTGTGERAEVAILVRGGKIVAWYRLPEDPTSPSPRPPAGPVI